MTRWFEQHPLLSFLLITSIGFVVWLVLLLFCWLTLRAVGASTGASTIASVLTALFTAAALVGASFVATRQLTEASRSRYLDVADKLFNELNAPENVEARRWIFQQLPADPASGVVTLTTEGRMAIKRVLNSLDRIAFLTQRDWIPEEMVMPWMNPMIVKVWAKLGPYVLHERERRHEPDYYRLAGELAARCEAWRREHVSDASVVWVENAL